MTRRPDLARQITFGLVLYGALLSIALFMHGELVNEVAERKVWEAMLDVVMTDVQERRAQDGTFNWNNNGRLDLYQLDADAALPEPLKALPVGLHDEIVFNANEWVVLVREDQGERIALALDIDGFEELEWKLMLPVALSSIVLLLLLGISVYFGVRLLVRPLRELARRIASLSPDQRGQRLDLPIRASGELEVIATALNDYLERNDRFVERERAFIDLASHELRTPVTVIRSAAQVALSQPDLPMSVKRQLERIDHTTHDVEELVSMLLVLAKDPSRVRMSDEPVALHELLPEIVEDHLALCEGKTLQLELERLVPCTLMTSESVLRVAIGNLLRNAIEHSDQGVIRIHLNAEGVVEICDPGHGMSPEEISALYGRMARGGDHRAGIGLTLIARLSEHLGWHLEIEPDAPHGTRIRLDLSASRRA